ncbi:MAG: hypothetical protein Q9162_001559 [Coniocarpon cinnabarinum]
MTIPQLPPEIWDKIIAFRISSDLRKLLKVEPSCETLWTNEDFREADKKATLNLIDERHQRLGSSMFAIASVSRSFMGSIERTASLHRPEVMKRYWKLFYELELTDVKVLCRRRVEILAFPEKPCCLNHDHALLTIHPYNSAMDIMFRVGRKVAHILGTKCPSLEELYRKMQKVSRYVRPNLGWWYLWNDIGSK